ncbi:MAG: glutathione S-transferase N-terminal domain-containing protein [Cyanobacteria bacterium Co-bin13]|nr:glutathione S-transferase N-terminal domain-containing protein [Cyanobacteria bacterium Co-bin13]
MIDLYTFTTPNGRKPAIFLEEAGLPYTVHKIDISKGEQFNPDFVSISPNSKIPAIVDQETGLTVFESGAILIYLAEKTGKLLPQDLQGRHRVIQWLMFQMASVGPMFGQLGHFRRSAPESIDYAINRYEKEVLRLLGVMEKQLTDHPFLAGDYSIADIATYPWVAVYDYLGISLEAFPNVEKWTATLAERPAVQKGMAVLQPNAA